MIPPVLRDLVRTPTPPSVVRDVAVPWEYLTHASQSGVQQTDVVEAGIEEGDYLVEGGV